MPGDGGTGKIEDGWDGDNIVARPVDIGVPPEPTGKDMAFDPDVPPAKEGDQDERGVITPRSHARLVLSFNGAVIKIVEGTTLPDSGDGLGGLPPPLPSDGFILVVRSQNVNAPGGIYHINTFLDPLETRAYDPPTRGSHGGVRNEEGTARLRLPLLADDPRDALRGAILQVYRLRDVAKLSGKEVLLTPEFFDRNEGAFQKVFEESGESIIAILIGLRPGPKAPVGTSTITTVHRSGPNGSKFNLCIIGDGFSSSTTDQQNYRSYVTNVVLDMFRNRDVAPEIFNAVNIFRIDAISQDSGMTIVDTNGTVTTSRNRFSEDHSG